MSLIWPACRRASGGYHDAAMQLLFSTGYPRADHALALIVSEFEAVAPNQLRIVLLGSYASGKAHEASDLDLIVLFGQELSDDVKERAETLANGIARKITLDVDIAVCGTDDCPPVWAVALTAGRTVYGDASISPALPTADEYAAALTADVRSLVQSLRPGQLLSSPLQAPNQSLPLLGYEAKPLRSADGAWSPSTKALSMIAYWGASALIARRAGKFTPSRDDVIEIYRQEIGDDWTDLLVEIDRVCREEYSYAIPPDEEGCASVRALAERVLEFENYLLGALSA